MTPGDRSRPRPFPTLLLALAAAAPAQDPGAEREPPPAKPGQAAAGPQEDQGPRRDTIVVTATRLPAAPFDTPYAAEVVSSEGIRRRAHRTTPQALRDLPGVMVQETAVGHGSPYIRGFTSFRNLFLIDGIRLNASFFRPGPNQYWNTVDPLSLDRLEVVKGPSSVLYGSDAVGGTVAAFTRSPYAYADDAGGFAYAGNAFVRYASAEDSISGRGELSLGHAWESGARTGVLIGGGAKHFGDLEGGEGTGTQPNTGYDETDFDVKVEHRFAGERLRLVALHQRVRQDDVPRTHRTVFAKPWRGTTVGSDLRRDLDQDRSLTYLQLHGEDLGEVVDRASASLSWHLQKEDRDRIRGNGDRELQGFDVGTLGLWVQASSVTPAGTFTYGAEWYRDNVRSFLRRVQNPRPADAIQGPIGDDATYDLVGAYVQDELDVTDWLTVTLGGRFNHAAADADSVRDPVTDARIAIDDDWSTVVGSARFSAEVVPDRARVYGGVSQGFRAPNLSDLSRFDSARSNEFEIPAPGLEPEDYVGFEIGAKVETADANAQASYFYTDVEDQIVRFPTGNVNAAGEREVTKANAGDGHLWGIELGAAWRLPALPETTLFGNATYIEGRISNFESAASMRTDDYPSRLMPLTIQVGARWQEEERGRFWAETVLVWADDADKLSFRDQRDTQRIPPGGTPGYTVWHLRAGWHVSEKSSLSVGLENVTDADYRVHGSGQNRPGRNVVVLMSAGF